MPKQGSAHSSSSRSNPSPRFCAYHGVLGSSLTCPEPASVNSLFFFKKENFYSTSSPLFPAPMTRHPGESLETQSSLSGEWQSHHLPPPRIHTSKNLLWHADVPYWILLHQTPILLCVFHMSLWVFFSTIEKWNWKSTPYIKLPYGLYVTM